MPRKTEPHTNYGWVELPQSTERTLGCGVCAIICVPEKKAYIGGSTKLFQRRMQHLCELRRGTHYNSGLQAAFDKHGEGSLVFLVLERCSRKELRYNEQFWMSAGSPDFKNGVYNQVKACGTMTDLVDKSFADLMKSAQRSAALRLGTF